MCTSRFVLPRTEAYPAPGTLCAVDTRAALLAWYEPRRRRYPWRVGSNPYRVLVSEVMLQQTQAERVAPAFERFLERFPDVRSLAGASRADVLRAWGSLGYNRRAVRLSEAARAVVRDHGGRIPADPDALRTLPGVGPYTAAAVASIGHGVPVAAVDVNVRRVVARARLGRDPGEVTASAVRAEGQAWLDGREPAAWNQAIMDLGREVCRPEPRCDACPLVGACAWRAGPPRAGRESPRRRPVQPFEGSSRQLRGGIVRVLRARPGATVGALAEDLGRSLPDVACAVAALRAEGLVEADRAAMTGRPGGRVRLPRA